MWKHDGYLSTEILGQDTDKKWSELWYIFKPVGYDKTLAQMTDEERAEREKNREKYNSVDSMREFAKWYNKIMLERKKGGNIPPFLVYIRKSNTEQKFWFFYKKVLTK